MAGGSVALYLSVIAISLIHAGMGFENGPYLAQEDGTLQLS